MDADDYQRFEREQKRRRSWISRRILPPDNEIPGVVPMGVELGFADKLAVVLVEIHVYSIGLDLLAPPRGALLATRCPSCPHTPGLSGRVASSRPARWLG